MDYGEILTKAWQITWKHKILWLFGLFAGCASQGSTNSGQANFHVNGNSGNLPPQLEHFFTQIPPWQITLFVIAIIILALLFTALAIVLRSIGQAGLIKGTLMATDRQQTLSFREVWDVAVPYFWRILGLNLLIGLAILAALIILGVAGVFAVIGTMGIGLICLLPLICLLVPLLWLLSIYTQQANLALVVEDLSITDAIRRGWQVCRENPGEVIIMGLILGLGGGIIGLLIAAPMGVALAPIFGSLVLGGERALGNGMLLAGMCLVAYLPILLALGSVLQTYLQSAWTLTYTALTAAPHLTTTSPESSLPPAY
ncbi:MAG: hypothetical protein Fur0018_00470 [Anaerolineales bacterium]